MEKYKQFFSFSRIALLYSDVSNRNVLKMKQNSVQTTVSFESNLWRHIGKTISNTLHDVRVWFQICIGKMSFVLFAVSVVTISSSFRIVLTTDVT